MLALFTGKPAHAFFLRTIEPVRLLGQKSTSDHFCGLIESLHAARSRCKCLPQRCFVSSGRRDDNNELSGDSCGVDPVDKERAPARANDHGPSGWRSSQKAPWDAYGRDARRLSTGSLWTPMDGTPMDGTPMDARL